MTLEPATLEPITYEKVEGVGWKVPRDELARWAWKPRTPAPAPRPPVLELDPFKCVGCSKPLTTWAYQNGMRYCSKACRLAH